MCISCACCSRPDTFHLDYAITSTQCFTQCFTFRRGDKASLSLHFGTLYSVHAFPSSHLKSCAWLIHASQHAYKHSLHCSPAQSEKLIGLALGSEYNRKWKKPAGSFCPLIAHPSPSLLLSLSLSLSFSLTHTWNHFLCSPNFLFLLISHSLIHFLTRGQLQHGLCAHLCHVLLCQFHASHPSFTLRCGLCVGDLKRGREHVKYSFFQIFEQLLIVKPAEEKYRHNTNPLVPAVSAMCVSQYS